MRSLIVLALLSYLGAGPAAAGCRDAAGNLLAKLNCGFDEDASGWTGGPGAELSRYPGDTGVLKAVADTQGSLTLVGPCVAAQPGATYDVSARLRAAAGTTYFCAVNVYQFSDAACTEGAEPAGSAAAPPAGEWTTVEGSFTVSGAAKSLQLHPGCRVHGRKLLAQLVQTFHPRLGFRPAIGRP